MGYWRQQLIRFKEHIAKRQIEAFFTDASENSREMKSTYQSLGSIEKFLIFLEYMADQEDSGFSAGAVLTSVAGGF